eukprot:865-Hanusia_phi.AAC.1
MGRGGLSGELEEGGHGSRGGYSRAQRGTVDAVGGELVGGGTEETEAGSHRERGLGACDETRSEATGGGSGGASSRGGQVRPINAGSGDRIAVGRAGTEREAADCGARRRQQGQAGRGQAGRAGSPERGDMAAGGHGQTRAEQQGRGRGRGEGGEARRGEASEEAIGSHV